MTKEPKERILVVDDQRNWRTVLMCVLQEHYEVHTVRSFEEAEQILATLNFDVAILDVRLEDENKFDIEGLELLQRVKALDPKTRVIVITGFPDQIGPDVARRLGADAFLPKGARFDTSDFRAKVRDLIAEAR